VIEHEWRGDLWELVAWRIEHDDDDDDDDNNNNNNNT
jgi:hypothetical protein